MSESQKKCILITGAGGALAQTVIGRLIRQYDIVKVDFRTRVDNGDGLPSYCVDMFKRGFEDIFREHKIDAVIHLGRIGANESDRQGRYNANVLGTQKMFDLCVKYKVGQVLVLSTYYVYGANAYNPALITEKAPLKASGLTLDMVDSVELENLSNIYLWKHPELNITILRPCNIAGPGIRNTMSLLLSSKMAPVLLGFSPIMQFIHVEDMAESLVLAHEKNKPGIYNVAPEDYIPYQEALKECGCIRLPLLSIPPMLPDQLSRLLNLRHFPSHLINYFKYPVVIDGSHFREEFGFSPKRGLRDIFRHYRNKKPE